jgi:hypothetical protein
VSRTLGRVDVAEPLLGKDHDHPISFVYSMTILGTIYNLRGELVLARDLLKSALNVCTKNKLDFWVALCEKLRREWAQSSRECRRHLDAVLDAVRPREALHRALAGIVDGAFSSPSSWRSHHTSSDVMEGRRRALPGVDPHRAAHPHTDDTDHRNIQKVITRCNV